MDWRIIEGDCRDVLPTLPADSVGAIVCDPPYNVVNRPSGGLRMLDKGDADSSAIDIPWLAAEFARIVCGSIYVWCGSEQVSAWRAALVAEGLTTRQCVWVKTNPSPMNGQRLWLSAVELCIFARKPLAPFHRSCAAPVWSGPSERIPGFPCPKPPWLMRELITASSNPGDLILDPFAGSGSTGVAALRAGRSFVGVEMKPEYAAVARERLAMAQPALDAAAS